MKINIRNLCSIHSSEKYLCKMNDYVTTETLNIGKHSPEYVIEVYRVLSGVKRFGGYLSRFSCCLA